MHSILRWQGYQACPAVAPAARYQPAQMEIKIIAWHIFAGLRWHYARVSIALAGKVLQLPVIFCSCQSGGERCKQCSTASSQMIQQCTALTWKLMLSCAGTQRGATTVLLGAREFATTYHHGCMLAALQVISAAVCHEIGILLSTHLLPVDKLHQLCVALRSAMTSQPAVDDSSTCQACGLCSLLYCSLQTARTPCAALRAGS